MFGRGFVIDGFDFRWEEYWDEWESFGIIGFFFNKERLTENEKIVLLFGIIYKLLSGLLKEVRMGVGIREGNFIVLFFF